MNFFVILYLSLYVLGRSLSMMCIGKCVGSLRCVGVVLGILVVVGVVGVCCVLVVLVCMLWFCM